MKTHSRITSARKFGSIALTAALIALLGAAVGVQNVQAAATLVVTTTADTGPDTPAPGSLRAALASAVDGDTIDATGITGTITLTPGAISSAELVVDKNVTILGPGAVALTIDANLLSGVFHITPGHIVSIDGVSIVNGDASIGGGIFNDHSELNVSNCTFSRNSASSGGGIANVGLTPGTATLTVSKCVFGGNVAAGSGGAIFSIDAAATVIDSTLSGNLASIGGATHQIGATLMVKNSTLSGNSATTGDREGGGIALASGAGAVVNSTLSGNSAEQGGGIFSRTSTLLVANCTFSGNSGSSIYNMRFNGDAKLEIGSTIMKAGIPGGNINNQAGTVVSLGFNLSSDGGVQNSVGGIGDLNANGDQINTDPLLGPLANNGGAILTHLPLPNSPAIDRGTSDTLVSFGITTDQRGLARTVDDLNIANAFLGDGTDIGAVEVGPAAPPPPPAKADLLVSLGVDKVNVKQGDQLTYTITVQNFGPDTATNVVVNDPLSTGTTFVSAKANKGSFTAPIVGETGTVSWVLDSLANASQEAAQIQVTVVIKGKGTITNTVSVGSDSSDPNPSNNSATLSTSVGAGSGGNGGTGGKKK